MSRADVEPKRGRYGRIALVIGVGAALSAGIGVRAADKVAPADASESERFESLVAPFIKANCVTCHGEKKQKGKVALHQLGADPSNPDAVMLWKRVLEQLEIEQMPPDDRDQPTALERSRVIGWISGYLVRSGDEFEQRSRMLLPEYGNRVSHELLFNGTIQDMPASPSRLWRISPSIYLGKGIEPTGRGVKNEPLTYATKTDGLRDYASQEIVGESGFSMLMMAFEDYLSKHMHDVKLVTASKGEGGVVEDEVQVIAGNPKFMAVSEAKGKAERAAIESVIDEEFVKAMGRPIEPAEMKRYADFTERCIEQAGNESGLKYGLLAMYMSPEAIYRMELGLGEEDEYGRRMLSPRELSLAIAYALTDSPPTRIPAIREALAEGKLSTKADVERVVRRMIGEGWPAIGQYLPGPFDRLRAQGEPGYAYFPRVVRFWEEFFDYPKAGQAFKDGKHGTFGPRAVPGVAQGHIGAIVNADVRVFEELLTSPRFNVNRDDLLARLDAAHERRMATASEDAKPGLIKEYEKARRSGAGLPIETERAGFLTDPAWLIAHSKCTENDPVRRGKWIRERLLAGNVPDLPIGVDAKVPEDHDRTLRDRFEVVEADACWKCHRTMNPLGMAFEGFNDVGRIRDGIYLGKKEGEFIETISRKQAEEMAAKGEVEIMPVDATGELTGTGDPALDGPVKDARDLVTRLAKSDRVRQSIIRHAFRYWMGRNETLSDSRTLIAADKAYVDSGGKFSEVIVSLLASDSFLYRK